MSTPPLIAGLYPYVRDGKYHSPYVTLREIPQSLKVNPWYRDELVVLAGDKDSACQLEEFGLDVHRVFDDAPASVQHDMAHKMKHWMCMWAAREFGEFLWVDWDTISLRRPDQRLWEWCRFSKTPKFIRIPGYWATVNCGVYYGNADWADAMEQSFGYEVSEPSDELLWTAVLPSDVRRRPVYWWNNLVVHVQNHDQLCWIDESVYFIHTADLGWADAARKRCSYQST